MFPTRERGPTFALQRLRPHHYAWQLRWFAFCVQALGCGFRPRFIGRMGSRLLAYKPSRKRAGGAWGQARRAGYGKVRNQFGLGRPARPPEMRKGPGYSARPLV